MPLKKRRVGERALDGVVLGPEPLGELGGGRGPSTSRPPRRSSIQIGRRADHVERGPLLGAGLGEEQCPLAKSKAARPILRAERRAGPSSSATGRRSSGGSPGRGRRRSRSRSACRGDRRRGPAALRRRRAAGRSAEQERAVEPHVVEAGCRAIRSVERLHVGDDVGQLGHGGSAGRVSSLKVAAAGTGSQAGYPSLLRVSGRLPTLGPDN